MSKIIAIGLVPLAFLISAGDEKPDAETEGIKQTALDYAEGWYAGDAKRMERALHPDLAKRALFPDARSGGGKIEHMSAMKLVQYTRRGSGKQTPKDQQRADVEVLDVFGNAASVKLRMHDWVDYMHMIRMGDRWVIVNVLWEFSPEAKKKYKIPERL